MSANSGKKWIFIYGPGRTGSTYLLRLVREVAKCSASDWGLGSILSPFIAMPEGIDKKRFLRELGNNLLDSSKRNDEGQIDLVIKSACGNAAEFECYEKMFGPAERVIFTIREPSGYMASAVKKFPRHEINELQEAYIKMMAVYGKIKGEILDYERNLKTSSYLDFLQPLNFDETTIEKFVFKGNKADHFVTQEMHSTYKMFLQENQNLVFKI